MPQLHPLFPEITDHLRQDGPEPADIAVIERCRDLVRRLRGEYRIPVNDGHGPLNGRNTYVRQFSEAERLGLHAACYDVPPIYTEAAEAIEELLARSCPDIALPKLPVAEAHIRSALDCLEGVPESEFTWRVNDALEHLEQALTELTLERRNP